jgi:hypothetical protein
VCCLRMRPGTGVSRGNPEAASGGQGGP